jgi:hypothetical protein
VKGPAATYRIRRAKIGSSSQAGPGSNSANIGRHRGFNRTYTLPGSMDLAASGGGWTLSLPLGLSVFSFSIDNMIFST